MSQTVVKEGFDQSAPGAGKAPARETPDFAALAKVFTNWDENDLEVIWERNDEIQSVSQFKYFLTYAKSNDLDPLRDEVVASVRWNSIKRRQVLTPIVTIGVLRKRTADSCNGIDPFHFEYDGKSKCPVSASGAIWRKGSEKPFNATIWFEEYAPRDNDGLVTSLWSNKAHMFTSKCLEAQLRRIAFYDKIGDLLIDEETQRGAEAPAEEKPAEDEYKVGEKPAPQAEAKPAAEAETKPAEAETKPAEPETKAQVNGTPALPVETPKPPGQRAAEKFWEGKEQPAEPKQIKYSVRQVVLVDGKQELRPVNDPDQSKLDSASLRARALANEKKQTYVVVQLADDKIDTSVSSDGVVVVCSPPEAPKEKPKAPANGKQADKPAAATSSKPAANEGAKQEAPPDFDFMISAIRKSLGKPAAEADPLIKRYLGAYLNIPRGAPTPKDRSALIPAIQALYAQGHSDNIEELKANPESLGIRLSGRVDPLEEEFSILNWPEKLRDLARKVMEQKGLTAEQFIEWIKIPCAGNIEAGTAMGIAAMDVAALEIFFPLFLLVRGRSFEVADWALANGHSVTHAYQDMVNAATTPIDKWDEAFAVKVLDKIQEVTKPKEEAKPAKPAAPPPVDDLDSWQNAGLPFE